MQTMSPPQAQQGPLAAAAAAVAAPMLLAPLSPSVGQTVAPGKRLLLHPIAPPQPQAHLQELLPQPPPPPPHGSRTDGRSGCAARDRAAQLRAGTRAGALTRGSCSRRSFSPRACCQQHCREEGACTVSHATPSTGCCCGGGGGDASPGTPAGRTEAHGAGEGCDASSHRSSSAAGSASERAHAASPPTAYQHCPASSRTAPHRSGPPVAKEVGGEPAS